MCAGPPHGPHGLPGHSDQRWSAAPVRQVGPSLPVMFGNYQPTGGGEEEGGEEEGGAEGLGLQGEVDTGPLPAPPPGAPTSLPWEVPPPWGRPGASWPLRPSTGSLGQSGSNPRQGPVMSTVYLECPECPVYHESTVAG